MGRALIMGSNRGLLRVYAERNSGKLLGASMVAPRGEHLAHLIAWAIEHPDHEAVLDDSAARRCGGVFGIRLRGTLSLVALAKKRGWLPACRPVFNKMLEAGLFVSPELVNQVAESVGE